MFPYLKMKEEFIEDCKFTNKYSCMTAKTSGECRCEKCGKKSDLVKWLEEYLKKNNYYDSVKKSEVVAWCQSVSDYMSGILNDDVPDNLAIGLEYFLENRMGNDSGVRADMMIGGYSKDGSKTQMKILVVELKQWSDHVVVDKDGWKYTKNTVRNENATKQVKKYKESIEEAISELNTGSSDEISISTAVVMHNLHVGDITNGFSTQAELEKSKKNNNVFIAEEEDKLIEFICREFNDKSAKRSARDVFVEFRKKYEIVSIEKMAQILVEKHTNSELIEEEKKLRPNQFFILNGYGKNNNIKKFDNYLKKRIDHLFCGESFYKKDNINSWVKNASDRIVDVIEGGPGSGKTLLAMLFLNYCLYHPSKKLKVALVYKGTAPIDELKEQIKKRKKVDDKDLEKFLDSIGLTILYWNDIRNNKKDYDVIVFDEVHRFNGSTDNDLYELIMCGKYILFLNDERQVILGDDKDIYDLKMNDSSGVKRPIINCDRGPRSESPYKNTVIGYSLKGNPNVNYFELWSQFRCGLDDGYLTWVEETLGMTPSMPSFPGRKIIDFEFELIDEAGLDSLIMKNPDICIVSTNRSGSGLERFKINGKKLKWPYQGKDLKANEIRIKSHSYVQGLEYDEVVVLIGEDLTMDLINKKTKLTKEERLIKNRYRLLLTRGLHKCYIYCNNEAVRDHFIQCKRCIKI